MEKEKYKEYVKLKSPKSPLIKDCIWAFFTGGGICLIGQCLLELYTKVFDIEEKQAMLLCSVTLIFLSALLTGIGIFDNIARKAGAGTLVPITGFANAVVSPAIDSKSEGLILGVGAKIFTVAGPVLLYGTLSGFIYGVLYCIFTML